jgi:hypothetical protein
MIHRFLCRNLGSTRNAYPNAAFVPGPGRSAACPRVVCRLGVGVGVTVAGWIPGTRDSFRLGASAT